MSEKVRSENMVVIERQVDASVDVVWRMWTDADEFSAWYGPIGAEIAVSTWELRVGGARLVRMTVPSPGGDMTMWFAGQFLEIVENRRLAYTEFMADENGNPAPHGSAGTPGDHPATEVRVELTGTDGSTHMVLTHVGVPAGSPGAMGWAMAFDKLDARVRGE